jgi:predicted GNAT family N-acyltransferase
MKGGGRLKTCYVLPDTRSIADLVKPGELTRFWTITRINVPKAWRSQGEGTKLLKLICDDADRSGIALALEPVPERSQDYDRLVVWYRSHGFKMCSSGYMVRRPVTATTQPTAASTS